MQRQVERLRPQLERWEALCVELGEKPAAVALAWLLRNPAVTAPIVGPRSVEQLDDVLGALDVSLDADTLARLDEIFPGPGGAAPGAYAW
jgi:aryl-alcohol dehydrogenase-like predicted oxidoreductase